MSVSINNLFEEVKSHYDVVSFISQFVKLKKVGRNYVGLCPFHSEKTPSFTVSPEKQIFKCFGCGASGDVITFYMKLKGIDFKSALIELAERAGIKVEFSQSSVQKKNREILELNFRVAKIYQNFLFNHVQGERARAHLKERGLSEETWQTFFLGYAPPEGRVLAGLLRASKVDMDLALETGLLKKEEDGSFTDLFRDRIIFPIFNERGECIGFGGRALKSDVEPKYLNSPESKVFKKSEVLYGLFHSKDYIRKSRQVYLVEGYFDYLALWERGVRNVVATCGTALTEAHVKKILNFSDDVIVLFDGDKAGRKATVRAIGLFLKENKLPQVVQLPEGEDPDSYVRKISSEPPEEPYEVLIKNTISPLVFCYQYFKEEYRGNLGRVFQDMVDLCRGISDPLLERAICRELAFFFDISESDVRRVLRKETQRTTQDVQGFQDFQTLGFRGGPDEDFLKAICQFLIQNPNYIPKLEAETEIKDYLESLEEGPYFDFLKKLLYFKPTEETQLFAIPDPQFQEILGDLFFSPPFENKEETFEQIKRCISIMKKRRALKKLAEIIRHVEKCGNREEIEKLLFKLRGTLSF